MVTTSGLVKLVKAGFVVLDANDPKPKIIVFQYNPETLLRYLEGTGDGVQATTPRSPGAAATGGLAAGAGAAGATSAAAAGGAAAGAGASASGRAVAGGAAAGTAAGAGAAVGAGATGSAGATAGAGVGAAGGSAILRPSPRETVSFTIALDATDKLEAGDPVTQQNGVFPALSALEILMYPKPGSLTVWVSGGRRVLPVHISTMVFNEQAFDRALNPIRVEVTLSLQVLKDADLPANSRGRVLWDAHFAQLQQLAQVAFDAGSLAASGLSGI